MKFLTTKFNKNAQTMQTEPIQFSIIRMYENSYNKMKQIRLSDAKSSTYTTLLSLISNV